MTRITTSLAACILSLLWAATVCAQTSSNPPTVGFEDGFFIQSADGDNRLLFGFVLQADGRFSLDHPSPIIDTFTIRKARPSLSGRVARYFDFKLMPEFGSGTAFLLDAYLDIRFSPKFRVRMGKDKTPVGYEFLIGDANVLFPERSLASGLVPNRDVGVQVQGDLAPTLSYAAGVFNGVPDGTNSTSDVDTNNGKDVAGRVLVQPFRRAANNTRALNGFGFQVGGSAGKQSNALPVFRTSVGQTWFSYAPGVTASGTRTRIAPALFYYYKAFGLFGEYVRSRQGTARASGARAFTNAGWNLTGSYLLTGEAAGSGVTRPKSRFDPPAGKWGALQLLARYSGLRVDDDVFAAGFAGAASARSARQFTAGVNWFPASVIKYYAAYERTRFEGGTAPPRPVENVFIFRAQLGL